MKISEMTWKRGNEVMQRIAAPCANICDDKGIIDAAESGETMARLLVRCMGEHSADAYEIACALLDKTRPEIDEMKFGDVFSELVGSYDGVLAGFFTRSPASTGSTAAE